jgi:hypothetical protein
MRTEILLSFRTRSLVYAQTCDLKALIQLRFYLRKLINSEFSKQNENPTICRDDHYGPSYTLRRNFIGAYVPKDVLPPSSFSTAMQLRSST